MTPDPGSKKTENPAYLLRTMPRPCKCLRGTEEPSQTVRRPRTCRPQLEAPTTVRKLSTLNSEREAEKRLMQLPVGEILKFFPLVPSWDMAHAPPRLGSTFPRPDCFTAKAHVKIPRRSIRASPRCQSLGQDCWCAQHCLSLAALHNTASANPRNGLTSV